MVYKKIMLDESAYLETYIADKTDEYTRKAILVIPGGGYGGVCADREGEPVALAFLPYGYNAFVLHYSVGRKKIFPAQLIEASLAIKHIKDNAQEYGIDENEVFAVGFSAGGHLCATLGTMWDKKEIYDKVNMPYGYNKPKGIMLIYPVISGVSEFVHMGSFQNLFATDNPTKEQLKDGSVELSVKEDSSPAYIVHAANDNCVLVENSLILAAKYSEYKIPYEMHIYPRGEHGFALGNKITWSNKPEHVQKANELWIENAVKWAEKLGEKEDDRN